MRTILTESLSSNKSLCVFNEHIRNKNVKKLGLHLNQHQASNTRKTFLTNAVITIAIRLRSDYDVSRAIQREQKMNMSVFRRSHVVVESNANRNFDHFRRSRMRRGIVVS